MLYNVDIQLKNSTRTTLKMVLSNVDGVFGGNESPCVVILNGDKLRQHIELKKNDLSHYLRNIDRFMDLDDTAESLNLMHDLDMPVYSFTGNGAFNDLEIQQGGHRTYLLLGRYGVDKMPVVVRYSLADKFKYIFG